MSKTDADSKHVEDYLHYEGNRGTGGTPHPRRLDQHYRADVVSWTDCTDLGGFRCSSGRATSGEYADFERAFCSWKLCL